MHFTNRVMSLAQMTCIFEYIENTSNKPLAEMLKLLTYTLKLLNKTCLYVFTQDMLFCASTLGTWEVGAGEPALQGHLIE